MCSTVAVSARLYWRSDEKLMWPRKTNEKEDLNPPSLSSCVDMVNMPLRHFFATQKLAQTSPVAFRCLHSKLISLLHKGNDFAHLWYHILEGYMSVTGGYEKFR